MRPVKTAIKRVFYRLGLGENLVALARVASSD
jgi:hypothetical protein